MGTIQKPERIEKANLSKTWKVIVFVRLTQARQAKLNYPHLIHKGEDTTPNIHPLPHTGSGLLLFNPQY